METDMLDTLRLPYKYGVKSKNKDGRVYKVCKVVKFIKCRHQQQTVQNMPHCPPTATVETWRATSKKLGIRSEELGMLAPQKGTAVEALNC